LPSQHGQRIPLLGGDLVIRHDEPFLGGKIRQCPRSPPSQEAVLHLVLEFTQPN
jgi:hypothetical protein